MVCLRRHPSHLCDQSGCEPARHDDLERGRSHAEVHRRTACQLAIQLIWDGLFRLHGQLRTRITSTSDLRRGW